MKKRISIAFCLVCIWAICSIWTTRASNILSGSEYFYFINLWGRLLKAYQIQSFYSIYTTLRQLIPIVIVILLIINSKKEVSLPIIWVLSLLCIIYIFDFALQVYNLSFNLTKFDEIIDMTNRICKIGISLSTIVLIILSIKSIKQKVEIKQIKVFGIIPVVLTVFYAILIFVGKTFSPFARNTSIVSLFIPAIISLSLWVLPKTIYDYDNCVFLTKTKLVFAGIAVACVAVSILLFSAPTQNSGPSCGHQACEENGPFPCYGKNNTCPNKTDCYQDLYCDKCD